MAMPKPRSTPAGKAPRKDTRTEADRHRGPTHQLVQFRRGEKLSPHFELRVNDSEKNAVVAKRHLERYFEILTAHRDAMGLSAAELDQVGAALAGLAFEDVSWVKQIPHLVTARYGGTTPLAKQLQSASLADLYAVLDAVERRSILKHGKGGR